MRDLLVLVCLRNAVKHEGVLCAAEKYRRECFPASTQCLVGDQTPKLLCMLDL
jgi:hypothetical protein